MVKDSRLVESGELIAALRNHSEITQDVLAERVNATLGEKVINRKTISRIETGNYDPHLTTFFGIVEGLSVTPNEISPRKLLAGTPLERYGELNKNSLKQLRRMIDILIDGQSSSQSD